MLTERVDMFCVYFIGLDTHGTNENLSPIKSESKTRIYCVIKDVGNKTWFYIIAIDWFVTSEHDLKLQVFSIQICLSKK